MTMDLMHENLPEVRISATLNKPRKSYSLAVILVCFLLTWHGILMNNIVSANACSGCYNGGELLLPNNIFGLCRCRCSGGYKGPQCEFGMGKRTSESALAPESYQLNVLEQTPSDAKLNRLKDMLRELRSRTSQIDRDENEAYGSDEDWFQ